MAEIFIERQFTPPLSRADVIAMSHDSKGRLGRYRVFWQESFLALDGHQMLCRFHAHDTESARRAFQQSGSDSGSYWSGSVHVAPTPALPHPTVVVERRFAQPVTLASIQAIEDAGSWCLQSHRVTFVRTFFALDRTRMICLYHAPDAEAVRHAQRQAGVPLERVWACQRIAPGDTCAD